MDKNEMLCDFIMVGAVWGKPFLELTAAQQVCWVVFELEGEVNNGGFQQYYESSSCDMALASIPL